MNGDWSPRTCRLAAAIAAVLLCAPASATAQGKMDMLKDVGVTPKLGEPLPLDVMLRDSDGREISLRSCFRGKPVILTPVYYRCPMLCGLELNGLVRCLRAMPGTIGEDFDIVTFSIDPREDASLAAQKRTNYLTQYGRDTAQAGWRFLTGEQAAIDKLCDAIGFRAKFNPKTGEYLHAAAIIVATPDGVISRYLYGVEFAPRDLRLAVVEASDGTVGTLTEHVLLFCYAYDPTTGKYGVAIQRVVRGAGILTVLALALGVWWMLWRERRGRLAAQHGEPQDFLASIPHEGGRA